MRGFVLTNSPIKLKSCKKMGKRFGKEQKQLLLHGNAGGGGVTHPTEG